MQKEHQTAIQLLSAKKDIESIFLLLIGLGMKGEKALGNEIRRHFSIISCTSTVKLEEQHPIDTYASFSNRVGWVRSHRNRE